jgi:hypothetical protein
VEKYGTARQATSDIIIRRMRSACCIIKATDTHSEYVILIAFPQRQCLHESASVLLLSYIDRLFEGFLSFMLSVGQTIKLTDSAHNTVKLFVY